METNCTHAFYAQVARDGGDACRLMSDACAGSQSTFNFFELYYCSFHHLWVLLPLMVLAILVIFKFITETVENYIVPAVVVFYKYLQMSDALAGVTLLAFANGMGDVLTAFVASDSPMVLSYTIGALYGAGLFALTIVIGLTILHSPRRVIVHKSNIFRDVTIYIAATMLLIFFAYRGRITLTDIVLFISLYFLLVLLVVVQDKYKQAQQEARTLQLKPSIQPDDEELEKLSVSAMSYSSRKSIHQQFVESAASLVIEEDWGNVSFASKVMDVIDYPFYWLRRLTIPPCNPLTYNRFDVIAWPLLGVPFLYLTLARNLFSFYFVVPVVIGLVLLFYFTLPKDNTVPNYFIVIIILGIVVSLVWSELVCSLLLDIITFIGVTANLSFTYLGLTILAIGNALTDSLTVINMAKKGHAIMGITGGYAAQVFALLVGFGIAMLKRIIKTGKPVPFGLFHPKLFYRNEMAILLVLFTLCVLVFTYIYAVIRHFRYDRTMAFVLITIYSVFFVTVTTISIYNAVSTF